MEIVIKSASIVNSLFLKYSFDLKNGKVKDKNATTSDRPIHDDLRNAFRALIPHFVFISEEIVDEKLIASAIKKPEAYLLNRETAKDDSFFKYFVDGFAIVDRKGFLYLTISGTKQLSTFETIGWSTPEIDFDDKEYKFQKQLSVAVDVLKSEVTQYMEGKEAIRTQTEMDFEEETPMAGSGNAFNEMVDEFVTTMEVVGDEIVEK